MISSVRLKFTDIVNKYKKYNSSHSIVIGLIVNLLSNSNRLNRKTLVINLNSGYYIVLCRFSTGH